MIDQIYRYWDAYLLATTLISAAAMLPYTFVVVMRWYREKQYQSYLRMSALIMGRYAVFDSWVRAGGRHDALMEDLERSIREEHAAAAANIGPNYLQEFTKHETAADEQLMALIESHGLPKGVTYGDPFKEDLCSACGGTGYVMIEHHSLEKRLADVKAPCRYCFTGKNYEKIS